jgi:hypothetical protein
VPPLTPVRVLGAPGAGTGMHTWADANPTKGIDKPNPMASVMVEVLTNIGFS